MNRSEYFKDKMIVFIWCSLLGIASLFSLNQFEPIWKIIVPSFLFGIPVFTAIYGIIKYKK